MGFELSDGCASYNFKNGNQGNNTQKAVNQLPPRPPQPSSTTGSKARSNSDPKPHQSPEKTQTRVQEVHSAPRPTSSIYRLISQKRGSEEKPQVPNNRSLPRSESKKRVQFQPPTDDSFDSTEDEELRPRYRSASTTEDETDNREDTETQSEDFDTQDTSELESQDNSYEDTEESDLPSDYGRQPGPKHVPQPVFDDDSDDMTFSAFVPPSVRRQSVLPNPPSPQRQQSERNAGASSRDSYDEHLHHQHQTASVPSGYSHRSTTNLVRLGQEHGYQESSSSLNSECSVTSSQSSLAEPPVRRYERQDSEVSDEDDRGAVDDFLDEALSDEEDDRTRGQPVTARPPAPQPVSIYMYIENSLNMGFIMSIKIHLLGTTFVKQNYLN